MDVEPFETDPSAVRDNEGQFEMRTRNRATSRKAADPLRRAGMSYGSYVSEPGQRIRWTEDIARIHIGKSAGPGAIQEKEDF